ncbi:hypothetical protein H0H93_009732, partial [Arthromyces matolae]
MTQPWSAYQAGYHPSWAPQHPQAQPVIQPHYGYHPSWAPQHPQAQPVIQPHYGYYPSSYPQHPPAHPGILPPPRGYYYGPHTGYYNPSSHLHQPAAQPVIPPELHDDHIGHNILQAGYDSSSRPAPPWIPNQWSESRIADYLPTLEEKPNPPAWYKEWFIAESRRNPEPDGQPSSEIPPWVNQQPPWTFEQIAKCLQILAHELYNPYPQGLPRWYLAYFQSIPGQPYYRHMGYHEPPLFHSTHEMPPSSPVLNIGHSHAAPSSSSSPQSSPLHSGDSPLPQDFEDVT